MSFTDGSEERDWTGFIEERIGTAEEDSEKKVASGGSVYIATDRLIITGPVKVRYEKYPWIEKFEVDGVKPAPAIRTGIGTKDARGFVKSLNTIYARAYDDYREFSGAGCEGPGARSCEDIFDAEGYFRHVTEHFVRLSHDEEASRLYNKFCGFTENMWREGNEQMYHTAMDVMIPLIREDESAWIRFDNNITEEFREYFRDYYKERYNG